MEDPAVRPVRRTPAAARIAGDRATRAVAIIAVLVAVGWSHLAIARHQGLATNAFDLGYVTQTLWYTVHGQPFRFTTIEEVPFSPEGVLDPRRLRHPHSLLAFHVEPILLLVAVPFALWPDPRLLLVLQTVALAGGALGAAMLANWRTGSPAAAGVFGTAFLLSPSIAATALADFHAVALGAALLVLALAFLAAGRPRPGFGAATLAIFAREDVAIVVVALGVYLWLVGRRAADDPLARYRRGGRWLALGAAGWALVCFGAIMPFFNGTIAAMLRGESGIGSIFWHRYAWLGTSPTRALANVIAQPDLVLGWFRQPDIVAYLAALLLNGGGLALAAPGALLIALPVSLQNALSSFDWMRSGGAHYSALAVPGVLFAAIEGCRRVFRGIDRLDRPQHRRGRVLARGLVLAFVALASAANHAWLGASPPVFAGAWPAPSDRTLAIGRALATIPAEATVSATSTLYPHVAARAGAYWFPARPEADYVAVDVATGGHPLSPSELNERVVRLLAGRRHEVAAVGPGYLLLRRAPAGASVVLPPVFYDFVRPDPSELPDAWPGPPISFGGRLDLLGHRLTTSPTLTIFGPDAQLTTYWRARAPVDLDLSFSFHLARSSDGALVGALSDQAPEPLWHPPTIWAPGEVIRVRVTISRVRALQAIGVSLTDRATDRRLAIAAPPDTATWEDGTIARVVRLN